MDSGSGEKAFFSPRQERQASAGRNFNVTNGMSTGSHKKSELNMTGGNMTNA